jgi:4-hydroxy-3-polyprenylbenzoate decarboxylase
VAATPNAAPKRLIVGISGASGAIYAERTLVALAATPHQVEIVPSKVGGEIFRQERGRQLEEFVGELVTSGARMRLWDTMDYYAPFSSGSQLYDAMVVVPCSGGALGRIAHGTSTDLVARAADVCLKENRPLVLVVREAPFSEIHLRNMLIARRAGATILPASPGFYSRPKDLVELADSLVQRILDLLGVDATVFRRWRDGTSAARPRDPSDLPAQRSKS